MASDILKVEPDAAPEGSETAEEPGAEDAFLDSAVDRLILEWTAAVPDVDPHARAIAARIARIDSRISSAVGDVLGRYSLLDNEFRLLGGLLRSGKPYRCSPSNLAGRYVPITSGGVTSLVNRLERRGLVRRVAHPSDQRSVLIELTRPGETLIRKAMTDFAEVERRLMSGLSEQDRRFGNLFLKRLLRSIEHAMI